MKIFRRFLFTRSELRGIIGLSLSIVVLRVLMFYIPPAGPVPDSPVPDTPAPQHGAVAVREEKPVPREVQQQPRKADLREKKKKVPIEINTADSVLLLDLPGIGPAFAKRIIRYRELLGGYATIRQLMEVYGMDSARFAGFAENVVIDTSKVVKLNVNLLTFKELLKHPYLEFEHVKAICNYREKNGPLGNPLQLWTAGVLPDSLKEKLSPYLKTK